MIRDCRNVTTVEEMFQQICQHIKGQFLSEIVSFCCYFDLKYHVVSPGCQMTNLVLNFEYLFIFLQP